MRLLIFLTLAVLAYWINDSWTIKTLVLLAWALLFLAILYGVMVIAGLYARRRRDRLARRLGNVLKNNNYFVGSSIEAVVAVIGAFQSEQPRYFSRTGYVWGYGNQSVLLIADAQGVVVDYCPGCEDWETVKRVFREHEAHFIGMEPWAIKKYVGESNDYCSLDFGDAVEQWHGPNEALIELELKRGFCTAIMFKNC